MRLEDRQQKKGPRWGAYLAAIALVVIGGTGYRLAAARYERLSTSIPIPKGTLKQVDSNIAEWVGKDIPLDERIVKATDTDDHINRLYRRSPHEAVSLFVAYGVQLRDMMPHRPEVCYISAGWTLDDARVVDVALDNGQTLPVRLHHFRRGGLESRAITVLNYYLVDGEYSADVELLRSKARQLKPQGTYSAQVQITTTSEGLTEREDDLVQGFAAESASTIRSVLTEAVQKAASKPS